MRKTHWKSLDCLDLREVPGWNKMAIEGLGVNEKEIQGRQRAKGRVRKSEGGWELEESQHSARKEEEPSEDAGKGHGGTTRTRPHMRQVSSEGGSRGCEMPQSTTWGKDRKPGGVAARDVTRLQRWGEAGQEEAVWQRHSTSPELG